MIDLFLDAYVMAFPFNVTRDLPHQNPIGVPTLRGFLPPTTTHPSRQALQSCSGVIGRLSGITYY